MGPEEVCCHGDQCGLFFFWIPLCCMQATYWDLVAMTTPPPTTPVSHIAEIERTEEPNREKWDGES